MKKITEKAVQLVGEESAKFNGEPGERIGDDIRRLKKILKLTLSDLADKTGMSVGHLSQVERNISSPTVKTMFDISHALGVNVSWFFYGSEDNKEGSRYIVRADKRMRLSFESGITDYQLNTKAVADLARACIACRKSR